MKHTEKYLQSKWVTENPDEYDERDVLDAERYCNAYLDGYNQALNVYNVSQNRFNKGDIVICWVKGGSYGDRFTVLKDTGGLTLLCHKTGGICIVNNRDGYDLA